jgi:hypothetical protein
MAVPANPPNTIYLGGGMNAGEGGITYINDQAAVEAITPGMLLELHDDGGTPAWGVHDVADDPCPVVVALEQVFLNQGVDDNYADGDLVYAGALRPGSMFWGIVASGANINIGDRLQSAGNGKLKAAASGDIRFVSHTDTGGAVTEDTRVKVEVL